MHIPRVGSNDEGWFESMPLMSVANESASERDGGASVKVKSSIRSGMSLITGSVTGGSSCLQFRLNAGIGCKNRLWVKHGSNVVKIW